MKRSKRYRKILQEIPVKDLYSLDEALEYLKKSADAKFDESVDIVFNLGVDPRKQDQMIRGSVKLPAGTGKEVRVLVFAKGDKEKEAKEAGADYVGLEEYVEKINKGWLDFDAVVATPDTMSVVGKLGRILGPRKLMPSPKTGTVTFDVGKVVKDLKKGLVEFKTDKTGNIHSMVGKVSFEKENLKKNILAFLSEILRLKPQNLKGQYVKSIYVSSTMGPSFKLDVKELTEIARKGE